jgi:hypothetical protein
MENDVNGTLKQEPFSSLEEGLGAVQPLQKTSPSRVTCPAPLEVRPRLLHSSTLQSSALEWH